jgi:type IV fimbrial biogenesis protein FimT
MISLTIGGILLAIAIPAFRTLTASTRLTTQVNDIVGAINLARSEAIKRNTSIEFCRVTSSTATACATNTASWANWIVETAGGSVIRRGSIDSHNGAIVVQSTLTSDQLQFSSDGLASTGGALVSASRIDVCANNVDRNNIRRVALGAGSHISTATITGGC